MKQITIDELKKIQLAMLKDIDFFCKSNNITYFLSYGTLLGAIRHKGYIPWDDDIDICMPRPDYERFINLYENKQKNYHVKEFRKTKGYGLPFAKVSNENTIMNEFLYYSDVFGVYVDVFPIDGYGEKKQITQSQWLSKFLNAKKAVLGRNRSLIKNIVIAMGKLFLSPFSVQYILKKMHSIATKYSYTDCSQTDVFCSSTVEREIVPRTVFDKIIEADFEDCKFKIPANYDIYLKALYGDYMTPPPIENRISHHAYEAWWKD